MNFSENEKTGEQQFRCGFRLKNGKWENAISSTQKPPLTEQNSDEIASVPGYDGVRLPLDGKIMPTAITWTADGTLAFCSLQGQVYLAKDTDNDGVEDKLLFEEGLAAPFGLIADGKDLIVSHKPELLRLRDTDGDGRADVREVIATGWGYSDNYHDWTHGIVRDSKGNLYMVSAAIIRNRAARKRRLYGVAMCCGSI